MNIKKANAQACLDICYSFFSGKIGIRTLDTVARILHFECSAIDHSAIFTFLLVSRDCEIRTHDLLLPKQAF